MSLKNAFAKAQARRTTTVPVPILGNVTLRSMTADERSAVDDTAAAKGVSHYVLMVMLCYCNEDGQREAAIRLDGDTLKYSEEDLAAVKNMDSQPFVAMVKAIVENFEDVSVEDAKKNLEAMNGECEHTGPRLHTEST